MIKVLNLYAGIGGNRKLWTDCEVTAVEINPDIAKIYQDYFPNDKVIIADAHQYLLEHYKEFDFIWSSPPCQTHSRARLWGWKNDDRVEKKYPDMRLYQEIIFLDKFSVCNWVVENVMPYYDCLIEPTIILGRHPFWSNFYIEHKKFESLDINRGLISEFENQLGFRLKDKFVGQRKDQILRNCVLPKLGLHIFNEALSRTQEKQKSLFDMV